MRGFCHAAVNARIRSRLETRARDARIQALFNLGTRLARNSHLGTVLKHLKTAAARLIGLRINQSDIRSIDSCLFLNDAALLICLSGLLSLLDNGNACDNNLVLGRKCAKHFATFTFVFTGDDLNLVTFLDFHLSHEHLTF